MKNHILLFPTVAVALKHESLLKINIKGWLFTSDVASRRWKLVSAVSRRILTPPSSPGGSQVEYQETFTKRTELFYSKPVQASIRVLVVGRDTSNIHFLQPKQDQDLVDELEFSKLNEELLQSGLYPFVDIVTDGEGLFNTEIVLNRAQVASITPDNSKEDSPFRILAIVLDDIKINDFATVPIIENSPGISFISDVDDTIKLSNVYKGMVPAIRTALFHDLADVPGMADAYNYLSSKGVGIHYVSAGPYQLIPVLETFLSQFKFPRGSLSLRNTRKQNSVDYKIETILKIMTDFPNRKFILVGDSGEKDIEIYKSVKALKPDQVVEIMIRDVGNNLVVDENGWKMFTDPAELISIYARLAKTVLNC